MKNKIIRFIHKYVVSRKAYDGIFQCWFGRYVELDGRLRDARLSHLASQEAAAKQYNMAIDHYRLTLQEEIDRDRLAYTLALEVADQEIELLKAEKLILIGMATGKKLKCSKTNLKRKKKD